MNKTELIDNIAEQIDASKAEATRALDAVLDNITHALVEGGQLTLVGFGTFVVRERAARKGHNPQTGEEIEIKASKTVGFKPGKALKEAVKESATVGA